MSSYKFNELQSTCQVTLARRFYPTAFFPGLMGLQVFTVESIFLQSRERTGKSPGKMPVHALFSRANASFLSEA